MLIAHRQPNVGKAFPRTRAGPSSRRIGRVRSIPRNRRSDGQRVPLRRRMVDFERVTDRVRKQDLHLVANRRHFGFLAPSQQQARRLGTRLDDRGRPSRPVCCHRSDTRRE